MKLKEILAVGWIISAAFFFSSCISTSPPAGVNIMVLGKPEVDITGIYLTDEDHDPSEIQKFIIFCAESNDEKCKNLSTEIKSNLENSFGKATDDTFRIKSCEEDINDHHPKLLLKILECDTKDSYPQAGYHQRLVSAKFTFSLKYPNRAPKSIGDVKTYEDVKHFCGLSIPLKTNSEMTSKLAEKIAKRFIKQVVPIEKREFREFDVSQSDVKNGVMYAEDRNWDLAIQSWEELVSKDKKNAAAYYNLGIAYEVQEKYKDAYNAYEEACKLDQGNNLYSGTMGKFTSNKKVYDALNESKADIERGSKKDDDSENNNSDILSQ